MMDTGPRIRIRIRYDGYGTEDPDPYKNLTDPEHCLKALTLLTVDTQFLEKLMLFKFNAFNILISEYF
jgi:hypothetical protein